LALGSVFVPCFEGLATLLPLAIAGFPTQAAIPPAGFERFGEAIR